LKLKNKIAEIEKKYSVEGKRKINIDPGYFNDKEVILASYKGKVFKKDLGEGIFIHKVLEFDNGKVKDFFHTFLDFKSKLLQEYFLSLIK